MIMLPVKFKTQHGFSLLEVLIALLVLSIGLLGLAALQAVSLKANHSAYTRTQAIYLAYDIIDRIKANRNQALSGEYDLAMNASPPAASATNLADTDLNEWITDFVAVLLPGGDGSVDCTSTTGVCTVVVQWDESRLGGTASSGAATAQFSFSSQI
jgi:type IV pilus assembly protein PilV